MIRDACQLHASLMWCTCDASPLMWCNLWYWKIEACEENASVITWEVIRDARWINASMMMTKIEIQFIHPRLWLRSIVAQATSLRFLYFGSEKTYEVALTAASVSWDLPTSHLPESLHLLFCHILSSPAMVSRRRRRPSSTCRYSPTPYAIANSTNPRSTLRDRRPASTAASPPHWRTATQWQRIAPPFLNT
jgi:hypothetical protein